MPTAVFAMGVDVGGKKKGFHLATLDENKRLLDCTNICNAAEAAEWIASRAQRDIAIAVDCPRTPAPDGEKSREEERCLSEKICHCYFTPNAAKLKSSNFYGWILNGLEFYACLENKGFSPIECFPTASWTRLVGKREGKPRAAWTVHGLPKLGVSDIAHVREQDERDAVCAAVTAWILRKHPDRIERFGDIHVPRQFTSRLQLNRTS